MKNKGRIFIDPGTDRTDTHASYGPDDVLSPRQVPRLPHDPLWPSEGQTLAVDQDNLVFSAVVPVQLILKGYTYMTTTYGETGESRGSPKKHINRREVHGGLSGQIAELACFIFCLLLCEIGRNGWADGQGHRTSQIMISYSVSPTQLSW